jgi:hypothetical protein
MNRTHIIGKDDAGIVTNSVGKENSCRTNPHFVKFGENQKILIKMQLNGKFLEIQNSAKFTDNSIEFFKNSATDYRPI